MYSGYLFDSHCDTMSKALDSGESIADGKLHFTIEKVKGYRGVVQFFAAFIDPEFYNAPMKRCLAIIRHFEDCIAQNGSTMAKVTNYGEMIRALNEGKIASFLTVEGGEALDGGIESVQKLYDLGVRCLTLTWNFKNKIACGIFDDDKDEGISQYGKEVIREMNRLNMLIDVSHIANRSFWEVMELSQKSVLATHSNSKAIADYRRNLTDEQFKAIVQSGGMVGLNMCALFLNIKNKADVTDIVRHIDHFLSLGGENHIGLGADFDGIDDTPDDITSVDKMYLLADALLREGYSDELIHKIMYKNYFSFIQKVL